MYVCTEKKRNVYFLYLSMHVSMPFSVSISLCQFNFIKQLYLIFLLNVFVFKVITLQCSSMLEVCMVML